VTCIDFEINPINGIYYAVFGAKKGPKISNIEQAMVGDLRHHGRYRIR
jgi:hypothetical protein